MFRPIRWSPRATRASGSAGHRHRGFCHHGKKSIEIRQRSTLRTRASGFGLGPDRLLISRAEIAARMTDESKIEKKTQAQSTGETPGKAQANINISRRTFLAGTALAAT